MQRPIILLPLLVLVLLADHHAESVGIPMQGVVRSRYPRRDSIAAYNIHKSFEPREVNALNAQMARKAMVDVQQTISEVQRLLALDPALPRLTKGEIEELFENVTREELEKSIREGDHNRAKHMRALMLVLPYHANNVNPDNVEDIYTLPPVTKVVGPEGASSNKIESLGATGRQIATPPTTTTTAAAAKTTQFPVFRHRSTSETTNQKPLSTTQIPITTIRFTTPKPTTFHPALVNTIREEPKPASTTPESLNKAEINSILASIGFGNGPPPTFRPLPAGMTTPVEMSLTTATRGPFTPSESAEVSDDLKMLLRSFGLLQDGSESVGITKIPPVKFQEIPEYLSDIEPANSINNETPQVDEPEIPAMAKPDIRPDDFVAFKPLPDDVPLLDGELDQLLKSFGLLDNSDRKKKSMKEETTASPAITKSTAMEIVPMIDRDLVPQMGPILETLGIQTMKQERSGRKFETDKNSNGVEVKSSRLTTTKSSKKKIDNEDYRKLEQLWETIRELEKLNTNLTDDSLDSLNLRNFNLSESLLAQGPNPLESFKPTRKNDIKKRQQPTQTRQANSPTRISLGFGTDNSTVASSQVEVLSTTANQTQSIIDVESDADPPSSSSTTASSTTVSASPSSTTTRASSAGSAKSGADPARISALEDSFGGLDPVEQHPLPQPSRNGFYFLADWNSFLEVGEDPNKVIINFRPRAGDPSRFLPVNVP
ncbi:mucin-2 isoform X2 [Wyeomyia smithii]|nr:mucin-2 isoform X2 [Wyeomyia smithii]XP_055544273.1 mucin-2 isoform X2 [Wyeomyia smithii]